MLAHFDAFFAQVQPGPLGRRMCLWHAPAARQPPALLVHVHAFGEEMNKSRRMAALHSRGLAEAGLAAVFQMDLLGCGDSAGECDNATWNDWVADVKAAVAMAQERAWLSWPNAAPPQTWLWGHRAGCLLACQAATELPQEALNLLFWQPVLRGKAVVQQMLRLDAAGALMGKTVASPGTDAKSLLAAGLAAEVAGYCLQPSLVRSLEAARLDPPATARRLEWLDVAPQAATLPSPAAATAIDRWRAASWAVRHHAVAGPAFWQTTEIEEAPALIAASFAALQPLVPAGTFLQAEAASA